MRMVSTDVARGVANPRFWKFPDRLRKMRRAARLNGPALSRLAGINERAAKRMEDSRLADLRRDKDKRWAPRLDTVERLADALRVSPGWLAYGIEGEWTASETLRCSQVGTRLREAREAAGLSMNAVGRLAGSSAAAVLGVERGVKPALDTLEALATALGVSPSWLAFGLGDRVLPRRRTLRAEPTSHPG